MQLESPQPFRLALAKIANTQHDAMNDSQDDQYKQDIARRKIAHLNSSQIV
jgi:hypothetical protein